MSNGATPPAKNGNVVAGWTVASGGAIGTATLLMWLLSNVNGMGQRLSSVEAKQGDAEVQQQQADQRVEKRLDRIERAIERVHAEVRKQQP